MNRLATACAQTWLILRHDLRLMWREVRVGKLRLAGKARLFLFVLLFFHAVFLVFFRTQSRGLSETLEAGGWAFFGLLMLGAAMSQVISFFFERADFDFLLGAPVEPRVILAARLATVSAGAFFGVGLLLMSAIDALIFVFSSDYLAGYAVWSLLAVGVSSLATWVTLGLVRWLGTRRARLCVQVLAACLGAGVYLLFQVRRFLPPGLKGALSRFIEEIFSSPPALLVARAGRGDGLALLVLVSITVLLAALTARLLGRTFLSGLQEPSTVSRRRSPGASSVTRFHGHVGWVTFKKDLRLIARDPLLLTQALPTLLYVLPLIIGGRRSLGHHALLASLSVIVATQLTSILSLVAAAGEECLDLIRSSPSSETSLRLAKVAAGLAVPLMGSAVLVVIIAVMGRPWLAALTLIMSTATAAAAGWLAVTRIEPASRKEIFKRSVRAVPLGRVIVTILMIAGASIGLSLIGVGLLSLAGYFVLGGTLLIVVGCFTLVEIEGLPANAST